MLTKALVLAPLLAGACATDAPQADRLPEGRYAVTWMCLDPSAQGSTPALVTAHQLVVLDHQLAFDSITIPISSYEGGCACTDPVGDAPPFVVCPKDADATMSGSITWGWQSWSFTATPVTAR